MLNLYNTNGLTFWNEEEIALRDSFVKIITNNLKKELLQLNHAFQFQQVEASILTPRTLLNKNYTKDDIFVIQNGLVLRPETTMGSYEYAKLLLSRQEEYKPKLPLVVWQHGKSFRNEQDLVSKNMRLKEFYQLEFQILYSETTSNDYSLVLIPAVQQVLSNLIGKCRVEPSDRLPNYSEETTDIVCVKSNMEVCSISKRKDYAGAKNLEIAIGTDRLLYNYNKL